MKINITIKPNSTKGPLIEPQSDGSLIIYVREVAAENQANEALIRLLAKHLNVSKTQIKIISGTTSRHKLIEIDA